MAIARHSAIIALFGPTKPIIADFAWILALSFVASGLLLVKVANEQPERSAS